MHRSETVSGAALVHCRYATAPGQPWHGIPPLQWAAFTAKLHGRAEGFAMRHTEMPSNIAGKVAGRATSTQLRHTEEQADRKAAEPGHKFFSRPVEAVSRSLGPFPYYGPDPSNALVNLHSKRR